VGALALAGCNRNVDVDAQNRFPFTVHVVGIYEGLDGKPTAVQVGDVPAGARRRFRRALLPAKVYTIRFSDPGKCLVAEMRVPAAEARDGIRVTGGPKDYHGTWRQSVADGMRVRLGADRRYEAEYTSSLPPRKERVLISGPYTIQGDVFALEVKRLARNGVSDDVPKNKIIFRQYTVDGDRMVIHSAEYKSTVALQRVR
jgi:hypothetical protein